MSKATQAPSMLWWSVGASEIGTSHSKQGTHCQDAYLIHSVGSYLILVVSDGAGSAIHSDVGSKLASEAVIGRTAQLLAQTHPENATQWQELLGNALDHARTCLEQNILIPEQQPEKPPISIKQASLKPERRSFNPFKWLLQKLGPKEQPAPTSAQSECIAFPEDTVESHGQRPESSRNKPELKDYACTLLISVISPKHLAWAHIGDGWGVCRNKNGTWRTFSFPERGEFVNTTYFLTGHHWREKARHGFMLSEELDGVCLMTDGLEQCVMQLQERQPFQGFFQPFVAWLSDPTMKDCKRESELRGYLQSEAINQRTDDDKTLLLVMRGPLLP